MFTVTYEIVTHESAEQGDYEEIGFVEPQFEIKVPIDEVMADKETWSDKALTWNLNAIESFFGRGCMEHNGNTFTMVDSTVNYQTGADTRYSFHIPRTTSAASIARLARIFSYRAFA